MYIILDPSKKRRQKSRYVTHFHADLKYLIFRQCASAHVAQGRLCNTMNMGTLRKTNFSYHRGPILCDFSNLTLNFLYKHKNRIQNHGHCYGHFLCIRVENFKLLV